MSFSQRALKKKLLEIYYDNPEMRLVIEKLTVQLGIGGFKELGKKLQRTEDFEKREEV